MTFVIRFDIGSWTGSRMHSGSGSSSAEAKSFGSGSTTLFPSPVTYVPTSVVDPHHVDANPDADPDLTYHTDADPDSDFLSDVDPDPNFQPDADSDPDPDPRFGKSLKHLKKCPNRLIFHTFWLDICNLMRIRIPSGSSL
jgi:hypothetical protein